MNFVIVCLMKLYRSIWRNHSLFWRHCNI